MRYLLLGSLLLCQSFIVWADQLSIELALPVIKTAQYEPPFVAIWLEKKGQRRAVQTLALWYNDKKWLKDIRRWWRKAGRYNDEFDAISSATRVAGQYQLQWQLHDSDGMPLPVGEYVLYLEAVREHGNRTVLKQPITLGQPQEFTLAGDGEIGAVHIRLQPEQDKLEETQ